LGKGKISQGFLFKSSYQGAELIIRRSTKLPLPGPSDEPVNRKFPIYRLL
jgi:hypothetical protein